MILNNFAKFKKIKPLNLFYRNFNTTSNLSGPLRDSPNSHLDKNIYDRYMCLPIPECKVQLSYIWIDGTGEHLRCKTRTLNFVPNEYKELPTWSYDASSTNESPVSQSDFYLVPIAMYNDPIRRGKNKLVLCETFDFNEKPGKTNHRQACVEALNNACDHEVMFGFEQEYVFMGPNFAPFGWPTNGEPPPPGKYYCGVGTNRVHGREIAESFYRSCLYCGIDLYGINSEVMLSQWEFQTGPTLSIKAADDLWMARWLLLRIAEDFGVGVSFYPKMFPNWNGSGMHTNVSTKKMREPGGYPHIEESIKKLERCHPQSMQVFDPKGGKDNKKRLTGKHETSKFGSFSWGVADRGVSVRISKNVAQKKKGFFEDRRPAANADPYQVINNIVRIITN